MQHILWPYEYYYQYRIDAAWSNALIIKELNATTFLVLFPGPRAFQSSWLLPLVVLVQSVVTFAAKYQWFNKRLDSAGRMLPGLGFAILLLTTCPETSPSLSCPLALADSDVDSAYSNVQSVGATSAMLEQMRLQTSKKNKMAAFTKQLQICGLWSGLPSSVSSAVQHFFKNSQRTVVAAPASSRKWGN